MGAPEQDGLSPNIIGYSWIVIFISNVTSRRLLLFAAACDTCDCD